MLSLVGRVLGQETSERQLELQKYIYTRNKEIAMEWVDKEKLSTFWLSDRRRSARALLYLYCETVRSIGVTKNIVG